MHSNSYWYLGLGIASLLLLAYVCFRTRSARCLLLFAAMVGFGYLIETVIYIFLDSYRYYPKLIKNDPYYDSNMGAVASNMLTLPAVATFIAYFGLGWRWITGLTVLMVLIEWLFLKLGIYEHHWWKLIYTAAGFPVYFWVGKVLYRQMSRRLRGTLHWLILYLIVSPLSGTLHILPIMLFECRIYQVDWFADPSRDTTAFAAVYYLSISVLHVVAIKLNGRMQWAKYVLIAGFALLITVVLKSTGILKSLTWWDPLYYVLSPCLVLGAAQAIENILAIDPKSEGIRQ
ncbi:hypothetical protein [Cohnella thailandensis]|uniref:Uncharacterized protein n=1 Tax=Cohnella thailandensis TaxID=557557 RepID=A0A841T795_9BACL|nr:hypothetical protein [Cohnella thailandensis]MBB6637041.1 hypothetical protein [Cohnella thailandensis]MBP1973075.1 hypothetical protein [Cohnella thailandensis]